MYFPKGQTQNHSLSYHPNHQKAPRPATSLPPPTPLHMESTEKDDEDPDDPSPLMESMIIMLYSF